MPHAYACICDHHYLLSVNLNVYTPVRKRVSFSTYKLAGAKTASNDLIRQAEVLEACCLEGGMIAIVHDHRLFQETPLLFKNSELAARNYPSHDVVSGKKEFKHSKKGSRILYGIQISYERTVKW
ncbi:hypothetical protein ACFLZM_07230 [Thermodesulfobacteriota bacterium]